ncbi:MAG: hypothetical protein LBD09_06815 [Treponema sp.]|jgi:hypothetical protein|nr:hypothetical protein [Treponema sp.]
MGQYDSWDYLTNFIKKYPASFEEELAKPPYAVKVKRHPERPNLVMFKYQQFESDFTNPVVRCCRGSVYDIGPDGKVTPYLLPFFKFANYGEKGADPVDWKGGLFVRDKLDGSLLKVMKEADGRILWTTNGSFDVDVEVPEPYQAKTAEALPPPWTFASLRDHALRGREREIEGLPPMWTFMFELTSPYNKIIVPYDTTALTLLGCRDPGGLEHTPEWALAEFGLSFPTPRIYPLNSIDEVLAYCEAIDSNDREGVVIQDGHFNRVKVKCAHYRDLVFLKGEGHFSDEGIFLAIKNENIDDALAAWPEIGERTEEIKAEWRTFREGTERLCGAGRDYFRKCRDEFPGDPRLAKKRYAEFVLDRYKNFSSFFFEAVKENADLETLFNKIEYRELRSYWLPALEGRPEGLDS